VSAEECLASVRIGSVRYLNSRPLIAGLEGVRLEHPSVLARALSAGELDVALVPVVEALRAPAGTYQFVDGVGIGSWGPVYSVFVAHREPAETWRQVVADPASLTSVHLLQVLLRMVGNPSAEMVCQEKSSASQRDAASLWIGNQAIALRQNTSPEEGVQFWDLGEVWSERTALPFVYALWVMRKDALESRAREVAAAFRAVAVRGLSLRDQLAREEPEFGVDFARTYLNEHIRFELGEGQKRGMERFDSELQSAGLLPRRAREWEWV
jgi:chorismate dehydratase